VLVLPSTPARESIASTTERRTRTPPLVLVLLEPLELELRELPPEAPLLRALPLELLLPSVIPGLLALAPRRSSGSLNWSNRKVLKLQ
jgi:hypothetical protein